MRALARFKQKTLTSAATAAVLADRLLVYVQLQRLEPRLVLLCLNRL